MIKPATGARRRILVGLDSSPASLAALHAALRLAVELDAEIDALYVEDANMLRFAGLPFTRIIDAWSAGPREVEPPDVERALRLQAQRVRRHLADPAAPPAKRPARCCWPNAHKLTRDPLCCGSTAAPKAIRP